MSDSAWWENSWLKVSHTAQPNSLDKLLVTVIAPSLLPYTG